MEAQNNASKIPLDIDRPKCILQAGKNKFHLDILANSVIFLSKYTQKGIMNRLTLICCLLLSGCVSYSKEVRNTLVNAYKNDFAEYTFRSTPVGTFGVGTMYFADDYKRHATNSALAATTMSWWDDNVSKAERDDLLARIVVPGELGDLDFDKTITNKLGIEASLPALYQAVDVGAGIDFSRGVTVTLKASKVQNRQIDWKELDRAIGSNKIDAKLGEYIRGGKVIIATADIIFDGYSATVKVDQSVNPTLTAKLDNIAANAVLGSGTSVKLSVSSTEKGVYEVTSKDSVVAAVLYIAPPEVGLINKGPEPVYQRLYRFKPEELSNQVLLDIER